MVIDPFYEKMRRQRELEERIAAIMNVFTELSKVLVVIVGFIVAGRIAYHEISAIYSKRKAWKSIKKCRGDAGWGYEIDFRLD
ncbi:hypothetical protein ACFL5Z_18445 [Planctomycetota bacterium]